MKPFEIADIAHAALNTAGGTILKINMQIVTREYRSVCHERSRATVIIRNGVEQMNALAVAAEKHVDLIMPLFKLICQAV